MGFKSWWKHKHLSSAILILAALFLLQVALALSSRYTVFPLYDRFTHERIEDSEHVTLLLFWFQLMLCLPTFGLLLIAFVVRAILSRRRTRSIPGIIPRDDTGLDSVRAAVEMTT